MILWGDIAEFPLFGVLQFLATQRRTGVLEIQDFEEQGVVYLSSGRIEAISLAQADEDLGSRLVAAGALTEAEVKECWMRYSTEDEGSPLVAHLLQVAHADTPALVSMTTTLTPMEPATPVSFPPAAAMPQTTKSLYRFSTLPSLSSAPVRA